MRALARPDAAEDERERHRAPSLAAGRAAAATNRARELRRRGPVRMQVAGLHPAADEPVVAGASRWSSTSTRAAALIRSASPVSSGTRGRGSGRRAPTMGSRSPRPPRGTRASAARPSPHAPAARRTSRGRRAIATGTGGRRTRRAPAGRRERTRRSRPAATHWRRARPRTPPETRRPGSARPHRRAATHRRSGRTARARRPRRAAARGSPRNETRTRGRGQSRSAPESARPTLAASCGDQPGAGQRRRAAGEPLDRVEVAAACGRVGERRQRGGRLRPALGGGHQPEVALGRRDPLVASQRSEDRNSDPVQRLAQQLLVGVGADPVEDHAGQPHVGVEAWRTRARSPPPTAPSPRRRGRARPGRRAAWRRAPSTRAHHAPTPRRTSPSRPRSPRCRHRPPRGGTTA